MSFLLFQSFCGNIGWNNSTAKVTKALEDTITELWIGKSTAKVNGIETHINLPNLKVLPEIIHEIRTFSLRFVTEKLYCIVEWGLNTKIITIIYQGE